MPFGSDKKLTPRMSRCRSERKSLRPPRRRAFTLIEWLISIAIIGILASLSVLLFRKAAQGSVMAQARNAVVTYAETARGYAIANHIETMLVVNPFNGRFEVWYSNPPSQGGVWSPQPSAGSTDPANVDSYAYAPILDPSARMPRLPSGDEPAAAVNPIDYLDRPAPAADPDGRNMDNLAWAAFCFDETGQLVIRTRRIATRSFYLRDGTERTATERNRLRNETPDLTLSPLVDARDTPITSARGFVISSIIPMQQALSTGPINPATLVSNWLMQTREGGRYESFAQTVVLNRFTGQQLLKGAR